MELAYSTSVEAVRVFWGKVNIEPRHIYGTPNVEHRQVLIEMMGLDRLFADAQEIDTDKDVFGNDMRLLSVPMPDTRVGELRAVQFTCPSTGRIYVHLVPGETASCQEARAALWRLASGTVKGQIRHGDVLLTPVAKIGDLPTAFGPERES